MLIYLGTTPPQCYVLELWPHKTPTWVVLLFCKMHKYSDNKHCTSGIERVYERFVNGNFSWIIFKVARKTDRFSTYSNQQNSCARATLIAWRKSWLTMTNPAYHSANDFSLLDRFKLSVCGNKFTAIFTSEVESATCFNYH